MREEARQSTPGQRDIVVVPESKLKVIRAHSAGSRPRGRPFAPGNAAAKGCRRKVDVVAQLDRQAKKVVQGLLRGATGGVLEPQRANAVVFALRFRAELYSAFTAAAEIATLRAELEKMQVLMAERLSS